MVDPSFVPIPPRHRLLKGFGSLGVEFQDRCRLVKCYSPDDRWTNVPRFLCLLSSLVILRDPPVDQFTPGGMEIHGQCLTIA